MCCKFSHTDTLNAICLPRNNATSPQSFHFIFTHSKVHEYNNNRNKKKRKSELVYHFIICITVETSQWPKKQSFLSLPLPQLAVSNGRWFHLQLGILLSLCPASLMHKNPQRHQGAKKVGFTACHSGKLYLACTSPKVISTSLKKI